ncbi:MAG: Flp pilus assembly complex ATPase component TadA [Candidatus Sericytochromatia bacterium]|nr:Flp pilus assembly complex ATPase component TadA [Candidatus Sericytochromatia bacterium]
MSIEPISEAETEDTLERFLATETTTESLETPTESYLSPFAGLSLYAEEDEYQEEDEDLPPFMRAQAQKAETKPEPVAHSVPETTQAKAAPTAPAVPVAPPIPQRAAAELAPEELQETLIVGGFSLNSGDSQYKQEESMLNYLIKNALVDQVSAIHIEPMDRYIRVRYRIGGVLQQKTALPPNLGMPMLARLKQLCALNAEMVTTPQQNRVHASFNEQEFELGLATYPTAWGENMVMSLRQKQKSANDVLRLDSIGLSPLNLWRLQKLLGQPGGLTIVTGPARSGKTTTLYAALNALNLLSRSIVTAENPLEHLIMGITQGNWSPENGESYPDLIRAMSHLDPDVLMVSQLDSPETVEATVDQALTGAKVLTSYHSFDTMGALLRLGVQGLESYLIASSNVTLISQRLVRKLCPHCRHADSPPKEFLDVLGLKGVHPKSFQVYWARGCSECNQMGYLGQTTLQEMLVLNESMREAILEHQPAARIRELARQEGKLVTMAEDGYFKATEGITSLSEVQRVAFVNEFDAKSPWEAEKILKVCKGEDQSYL